MEIQKIEYNTKPKNGRYPYFSVDKAVLQRFIDFLNKNGVHPQPPTQLFEASSQVFALELQEDADAGSMRELITRFEGEK